jgi:hypothetical protein
MLSASCTEVVFQPPTFWFNFLAPKNMKLMSMTARVSHLPMGSLNALQPSNSPRISFVFLDHRTLEASVEISSPSYSMSSLHQALAAMIV